MQPNMIDTVDGSEILHHLGCIKPYNGIFTIPTGAGFLPSTVWLNFMRM